jgi:NADH-quinone oxidoreductase subunit J
MNGFYEFQFYLFSLIAIASALLFVTRRNPVPAALWLVNVMFALSGLYVMLDAPFVGVIQVLVYAGAIMVVFVFVVMLLNLGRSDVSDLRGLGARLGAGFVALALLANLLVVQRDHVPRIALAPAQANAVTPVATSLFTDYLVGFELTSLVLLVAIVGAVLLAKKRVVV